MPHPQTPVPLPPFPALGSASRCPRKPAAGVRAPTFPVPHLIPPSSEPPNGHFPGVSLLPCLGFPHPGFISPVRTRSAPPQQKASLMLRGRPLRCPNPEWALGDPKTVLQNKGDPEGIRLGGYRSVPIFLHRDSGSWLLCPPPGCGEPAVCFVWASLGPSSSGSFPH